MFSRKLLEEKSRGSHLASLLDRAPPFDSKDLACSWERVNCGDPNLQSHFQHAENDFLILAFKACLGNHLLHPPPPRAHGITPTCPSSLASVGPHSAPAHPDNNNSQDDSFICGVGREPRFSNNKNQGLPAQIK